MAKTTIFLTHVMAGEFPSPAAARRQSARILVKNRNIGGTF
jgi:hypothetical protein